MNRSHNSPFFRRRGSAAPRKSHKKNRIFWWILAAFALMVGYVWMKVQINQQLAEIRRLEDLKRRYEIENNKLEAEKIRLSNFGRIQKIAEEELGLVFVPDEEIVKISKK